MDRKRMRIWPLFAAFCLFCNDAQPARSETAPQTKTTPQTIDFLHEALDANASTVPAPTSTFRKGQASPIRAVTLKPHKSSSGYSVQFPGNHPIPTPSVYHGKVYVSGGFGSKQYYALDAATGKYVWGVDLNDDGPSSAAITDGVVVVNTESCTIFGLDADTGKLLWSWWLGDPLTSAPTIAGGRVFTAYPAGDAAISGFTHVLAAFDLKTGRVLWQKRIDGDAMTAPIAADDELYLTTFPGTVYKLSQATGEILSAVRARATSAPTVVDKEVYFTQRSDAEQEAPAEALSNWDRTKLAAKSGYGKKSAPYLDDAVQSRSQLKARAKALDAGNGFAGGAPESSGAKVAAKNVGQDNVSSMQSFQGSRILSHHGKNLATMGDELRSVDPKTGEAEWSVKLGGNLQSVGGFLGAPPASAGGKIFQATFEGSVLQLNPTDGKIEKTYLTGDRIRFQPAVVDGRIYVGTEQGKLVVIETGNTALTGWPMWGGDAGHTGVTK